MRKLFLIFLLLLVCTLAWQTPGNFRLPCSREIVQRRPSAVSSYSTRGLKMGLLSRQEKRRIPGQPHWRGKLHRNSAVFFPIAALHLCWKAKSERVLCLSVLFSMAIEGILVVSAILHTTDWTRKFGKEGIVCENEDAKPLWIRKLDYSMIFVGIASLCTALCGLIIGHSSVYRHLITPVVWLAAVVGIGSKLIVVNTPRWTEAALFLAQGWACLLGYSDILAGTLPEEWYWMLSGGICFSVSVFAYILQWPKYSWHRTKFEAHEVFHLGTVGGFSCFYKVMLSLVLRVS